MPLYFSVPRKNDDNKKKKKKKHNTSFRVK